MRFIPLMKPLQTPYLLMAIFIYSEQHGSKRHDDLTNSGAYFWYMTIAVISSFFENTTEYNMPDNMHITVNNV